jgi:hypothetical protein
MFFYREDPSLDRSVLPGFAYYLQGGDPASYPGTGTTFDSIQPVPTPYYPAEWHRFRSTTPPQIELSEPTWANGFFYFPVGGGTRFVIPPEVQVNVNTSFTMFFRVMFPTTPTNNVDLIGGGEYGVTNQFNVKLVFTPAPVRLYLGASWTTVLGTQNCTLPIGVPFTVAIRRDSSQWQFFLDGVPVGTPFSSGYSFAEGSTMQNAAILSEMPPSGLVPPDVLQGGYFQSWLAYSSALSDTDILYNSERLALWGTP